MNGNDLLEHLKRIQQISPELLNYPVQSRNVKTGEINNIDELIIDKTDQKDVTK